MAKGRIYNRGKIRSLVRKRPSGRGPHWSVTKRAAVWRRRRNLDDVWIVSEVGAADTILMRLNKPVSDSISLSDTVNLNGEKVIIDSPVFSDDGFIKDVERPGLSDSSSITDSIRLQLQDNLMLFNNNAINSAEFNAIAYALISATDTQAITDSLSLAFTKDLTDTAIMSDNVGMSLFVPNQPMNTNEINLATLNG